MLGLPACAPLAPLCSDRIELSTTFAAVFPHYIPLSLISFPSRMNSMMTTMGFGGKRTS